MNYSDISDGTDANDSVTFGNIINDTFYVSPDLPSWVCIFSIEVLLFFTEQYLTDYKRKGLMEQKFLGSVKKCTFN